MATLDSSDWNIGQLKTRLVFIDALRGIAALSVLLFHTVAAGNEHIPALLPAMPDWLVFLLKRGELGVAIFFVLSGFVIALLLDGKSIGLSTIGRFMLRRSIRLDPPYWSAIIITILFSILASAIVKDRRIETFSVDQILAHLFYAQGMLGYKSISSVFWTLCLEIQFYLVYVLLLAIGRVRATLVVAGIVSLLWPLGIGPKLWPGLFLPMWHGFLLGAAAYLALRETLPTVLFVAYVSIIGASAIIQENSFSVICAVSAVLIFIVGGAGRLHLSLNWRWLQALGTISYSLYLIHNPITGAVFRVGKLLGDHSIAWDALWWFLSIVACIAAAAIMWILVESPSRRLARSIALHRKSELPTSSSMHT